MAENILVGILVDVRSSVTIKLSRNDVVVVAGLVDSQMYVLASDSHAVVQTRELPTSAASTRDHVIWHNSNVGTFSQHRSMILF
jgi:hypothetical protein